MGDVITHAFAPQRPRDFHEGSAAIDTVFILENESVVEKTRFLLEEASELLFGELGTVPDYAVVERERGLLSHQSLEEICALVIDFPREEWSERAEYMGALTLEYQRRHDHASYFAKMYAEAIAQ